jgi:tRNA (adenine57-N1/adenine58-N1)-methyltransferase
MSETFQYGDTVQINDAKNKHWTVVLEEDGKTFTHKGYILHSDIVGLAPGSVIGTQTHHKVSIFRPSTNDFTLSMNRGPTIIYPKDVAQIISLLDLTPYSNILESGVGSGGLSIQILKHLAPTGNSSSNSSVAPGGSLTSVEIDPGFAAVAKQNIEQYFAGRPYNHNLIVDDIVRHCEARASANEEPQTSHRHCEEPQTPHCHCGELHEQEPSATRQSQGVKQYDGIVFDLLKPWEVVAPAFELLKPGKPLICYVTTTTQLKVVVDAIRDFGMYEEPEAIELTKRAWHIDGLSVRPTHRESSFSGFIVSTRAMADGQHRLVKKSKELIKNDLAPVHHSKTQVPVDQSNWESLERPIADKKIKKLLK